MVTISTNRTWDLNRLVVDLPLWKIWVRQWEGWHPIYEMENNPNIWNHQAVSLWFYLSILVGLTMPNWVTSSFEHFWLFSWVFYQPSLGIDPKVAFQSPHGRAMQGICLVRFRMVSRWFCSWCYGWNLIDHPIFYWILSARSAEFDSVSMYFLSNIDKYVLANNQYRDRSIPDTLIGTLSNDTRQTLKWGCSFST
jgi:hypothetical protein